MMNPFIFLIISFFLLSCGTPSKNSEEHVIGGPKEAVESTDTSPIEETPPYGAVRGDFMGSNDWFYVYPKKNKHGTGMALFSEYEEIGKISLPKAVATKLEVYSDEAFATDILVARTQLEDPQFNKYHLFIFREGKWLPLVNGFAIHKSHMSDTLRPFWRDPKDATKVVRHYSVFDLDTSSDEGYTWRLLTESVPMLNR
ncbi:hypothetical protein MG296_06390 [Flavobacteriaceae bacterium TK19130]|nr:hypothetical protein [Thermobacterium salinum]